MFSLLASPIFGLVAIALEHGSRVAQIAACQAASDAAALGGIVAPSPRLERVDVQRVDAYTVRVSCRVRAVLLPDTVTTSATRAATTTTLER